MKVYLAGPLFSDGERRFNERVDAIVRACGHSTYLPQRDGGRITDLPALVDGVPKQRWLFELDCRNLESCDVFLFLLDGRVPDEGASFALGYCFAHGKRCATRKARRPAGFSQPYNPSLFVRTHSTGTLWKSNKMRNTILWNIPISGPSVVDFLTIRGFFLTI